MHFGVDRDATLNPDVARMMGATIFFSNLYRRLGRKNPDPCQVRDSMRLVSERQHTGVAGHVEIGWCALGSMASRQLLAYLGIWGWSPWSYA